MPHITSTVIQRHVSRHLRAIKTLSNSIKFIHFELKVYKSNLNKNSL